MIRTSLAFFAALVAIVLAPAQADAKGDWIKIATVEIDPRVAGETKIDLSTAQGMFRALRFESDKDVAVTRAKTRGPSSVASNFSTIQLKPGKPSSFFSPKEARFVDSVEIAWKADPAAAGPAKLEVWGEQSTTEASATRGFGSAAKLDQPIFEAAKPPLEAAPPPALPPRKQSEESLPKGARSMPAPVAQAPPPAPAPSAAKPPADRSVSKPIGSAAGAAAPGPTAPNVCLDTNVCTIVDVFYGTDRKPATTTPERVSYGAGRANALALGHAFVTVPKAQRAKGTISRPSLLDVYLRGIPAEGDPAQHFTIPRNGIKVYASEDEFLAAARQHMASAGDFKNHAFIYIHGYAVTFENAVYRAAQISYDLSPDGRPFGTAFLFSWPSAGKTDPFSYNYDQESADAAATHLREYIKLVSDKTGVENVHIIAHSMGNRVLIRALEQVALSGAKARLNQIVLAAPDVDKEQFETVIAGVGQVAKGITLYASGSDNALRLSREARGGGSPRAGEVLPPGPALVKGMDTIDISAISTSVFSWGHDTYAESTELLADIARILTTGIRPPPSRSKKFEVLQPGTLQYWRYK